MNKIHELSNITPVADLDIFSVPPTQLSIERNLVTEHRPIGTVDSNSAIEFNINPGIDEYVQLRDTMLYIKVRVDISKTTQPSDIVADDWKKIGIVNNFMHSLFRSVDLAINGKSVTMCPQTYAYKAYIESEFGYTVDAQFSHLSSVGFYEDELNKKAICEKNVAILTPNTITSNGRGKSIDLMGKLNLDLAFQPKALLGGTKLKITLLPNNSNFYLWCSDNTIVPTVVFESASLFVTRSKVTPAIVEAHNFALTRGPAKYPINRSSVKAEQINAGSSDVMIDNVINGQIPRRILIGLVKDTAFTGNLLENPYNFPHFNLNYLAANIDGVQYPSVAFQPDFANELYVREFLSIFDAYNQLTTDAVIKYEKAMYNEGNTLYGINFALDGTDDCHKVGYVNPIRYGSLGLHMRFSTALVDPIKVIVYCEYDNLIQINLNREVITDFV